MKNMAVVGAGYWGKNLVRVFHELGALKMVCDTDAARRVKLKADYPGVMVVEKLEDVLGASDVQAVAVATPAATHHEVGRRVLAAGKDCFIEKPLALSMPEGRELVELAEKNKRVLFVGHVLHYHPSIVKMKEMIRRGEIGKVDYIYSNRLNLGKFRSEENILWSFAPHDISLILSVMKEYPSEIYCTGGHYLHTKIADITLCSYKFESGARAHIYVSWLHPTKEQKLVVVGSDGMMVFDDTVEPDRKLAIYRHKVVWVDGVPNPQKNEPEYPAVAWSEPLRNECGAFLEAVEKRTVPLTDGREGLETLRLLNHSQQSLENGKVVRGDSPQTAGYFVHESSSVDPSARIGQGTTIWHFCNVMGGATLGKNCRVGQNVFIGKNVKIGEGVKIQNNVSVYERVEVDDYAFLGPSAVFTNVFNPRSEIERKNEYRVTQVGRGATIGANATVVCGARIGPYSFVGAGAVVTKDVKPFALVYGSPAAQKGWMCRCGVKLPVTGKAPDKTIVCGACKDRYEFKKGKSRDWECLPKGQ